MSIVKRKLITQGKYLDESAVKQYLKDNCSVQVVIMDDKIERIAFEHFAVATLKPRYND